MKRSLQPDAADGSRRCRASSLMVVRSSFLRRDEPSITFIKDTKGKLFGAFTTQPWRNVDKIFGKGDCFVWRLTGDPSMAGTSNDYQCDIEAFRWTKENEIFM